MNVTNNYKIIHFLMTIRNVSKIQIKSCIDINRKYKRININQSFYGNFLMLNKEILFLYGEVNDTIADTIIKNIIYLNNTTTTKNLTLMINSPGGSVTSGLAMYDSFNLVDMHIGTTCIALAASMGAFLLGSGYKGKRNGFNHCRIMIHQPLGGIVGSFNQIESQANELLYYKLVLNSYISNFSSQAPVKVMRDCDRDYFMSSREAAKYGIIDNVLK
uniref:ATP-dependent Clp protease proteolytic subunit n=1 Tax=Gymnochlora stellata TaxID=67809 RepID=B5A4F3_GYMST|nr:chloroplast ATP-dependent Clp protease proteolytic subunit 3 [Gymnochlora stellata]